MVYSLRTWHLPRPQAGPNRSSSPGNGPASASKTGAAKPLSGPSWGSQSRGGSSLGCHKASLGQEEKTEWVTWSSTGWASLRLSMPGPSWFLLLLCHPANTTWLHTPPQRSYEPRFKHVRSNTRSSTAEMCVLNFLN